MYFTFEDIQSYYTKQVGDDPFFILENTTFASVEDLYSFLHRIIQTYTIPISSKHWVAYIHAVPVEEHQKIWQFREFLLYQVLMFVMHQLEKDPEFLQIGSNPLRSIPIMHIASNRFSIVGSRHITSDIDVTIHGACFTTIIMILEDVMAFLDSQGIPVKFWDIEFYGDFQILEQIYVNVSKFNTYQRIKMLQFALKSYFRSNHCVRRTLPILPPFLQKLVDLYLVKLGCKEYTSESIIKMVYEEWRSDFPMGVLSREQFYVLSRQVEHLGRFIQPFLVKHGNTIISQNSAMEKTFAFDEIFFLIAQSNLHRPESYILPSTAVHVVKMEQSNTLLESNETPKPNSWYSSNIRVGVDEFSYIASAIEQLGYLYHYHPPDVKCNTKGIKYFGRLVRALAKANILPTSHNAFRVSRSMNMFRRRGSLEDCGIDVHREIQAIVASLHSGGSGRSNATTLDRVYPRPRRQTRKCVKS